MRCSSHISRLNSGSRSLRGLAGHLVAGSGVLAPNYTQLDPVAVAAAASATTVEVQIQRGDRAECDRTRLVLRGRRPARDRRDRHRVGRDDVRP